VRLAGTITMVKAVRQGLSAGPTDAVATTAPATTVSSHARRAPLSPRVPAAVVSCKAAREHTPCLTPAFAAVRWTALAAFVGITTAAEVGLAGVVFRTAAGGVASPLMEIVLLRHAQPEWNLGREAQVDPDLTELGRQQAELAAQRLATEHFDEVLVSTATRSQATAAPLLERSRPAVIEDRVWLHEIRMPASWQGTPAAEVGRRLRDARERPRDAWWEGMPGGESFRDFHARVTIGLSNELAERGVQRTDDGLWHVPDQPLRMLMIAHAGTNSVVLGHLLGLEPEPWEWERFASDHASLTLLRSVPIAGQHIFTLQSFSDTQHLPPELVSG
jgi:broad specificity phosphatase PhoE